jgi:hypothetical protein
MISPNPLSRAPMGQRLFTLLAFAPRPHVGVGHYRTFVSARSPRARVGIVRYRAS